MRVVSGTLGGRIIASPHGHRTHPMSDKLRGAIFGVLGDVSGLSTLDAFAGSGAVAIEALSRGAADAVMIDVDKHAFITMTQNIETLGLGDKAKIVRAYVNAWSTRHQSHKFDIIFADPPYDDLPFRDLKVLARHLKKDGVLVLSWPGKADEYYIPTLEVVQSKKYGDAQLLFYKFPN
jgi:16S rRNA (guanine966-N2)-methyltransferase